ncbi:hypothetical protein [Nocardioides sp. HB32]
MSQPLVASGPQAKFLVLVAECGCRFQGRFYDNAECTVLDLATVTGSERVRHSVAAEKRAKKAAAKAA